MHRINYSTTIEASLIKKTKALAKQRNLGGANDIVEEALRLYFEMQGKMMLEKVLPNKKYQVIMIEHGHMYLDYVEKRIHIDTLVDIDQLLADGYYCTFEG